MAAQITHFGTTGDGRQVQAIRIAGGALAATVLTHGARLQSLYLDGVAHSLTLGFRGLAPYDGDFAHFGAIIAPLVNRIGGAQAMIEGEFYRFPTNDGPNTLHSGKAGSHHAIWEFVDHGAARVTLSLLQPAGEGGFPGNRRIVAAYWLAGDTLHLDITAQTDAPTLMNIAHHGYWNMDGSPTWAGHTLTVDAAHFLPTTDANLPTGEIAALDRRPRDFREPRQVAPGEIPKLDHNFCLADARRPLTPVLHLAGSSGPRMWLATTEPGIQIFDAATIDPGDTATVHGRPYGTYAGLAFEPQFWPDAPNHPAFPSIVLQPGSAWYQNTTFSFTKA